MTSPPPTNPPLLAEHDTWLSLDPVLGCPASCAYCYLGPMGLTGRQPQVRCPPEALADAITARLDARGGSLWDGDRAPLPFCIGNHTDMLLGAVGQTYLEAWVRVHARRFPGHPLCVVTKGCPSAELVQRLDGSGVRGVMFFSQSFARARLPGVERGPICDPRGTAEGIARVAASRRWHAVHFWRPLTARTLPDVETGMRMLRPLRDAGAVASVAIGVKGERPIFTRPAQVEALLGGPATPDEAGETLPDAVLERALVVGRRLEHPVYRHTSCALALALGTPEGLGTWRAPLRASRCLPCACPEAQRARCATRGSAPGPDEGQLASIVRTLGLDPQGVRYRRGLIEVEAGLSQDVRTALAHRAGLPVRGRGPASRAWGGAVTGGRGSQVS